MVRGGGDWGTAPHDRFPTYHLVPAVVVGGTMRTAVTSGCQQLCGMTRTRTHTIHEGTDTTMSE